MKKNDIDKLKKILFNDKLINAIYQARILFIKRKLHPNGLKFLLKRMKK